MSLRDKAGNQTPWPLQAPPLSSLAATFGPATPEGLAALERRAAASSSPRRGLAAQGVHALSSREVGRGAALQGGKEGSNSVTMTRVSAREMTDGTHGRQGSKNLLREINRHKQHGHVGSASLAACGDGDGDGDGDGAFAAGLQDSLASDRLRSKRWVERSGEAPIDDEGPLSSDEGSSDGTNDSDDSDASSDGGVACRSVCCGCWMSAGRHRRLRQNKKNNGVHSGLLGGTTAGNYGTQRQGQDRIDNSLRKAVEDGATADDNLKLLQGDDDIDEESFAHTNMPFESVAVRSGVVKVDGDIESVDFDIDPFDALAKSRHTTHGNAH